MNHGRAVEADGGSEPAVRAGPSARSARRVKRAPTTATGIPRMAMMGRASPSTIADNRSVKTGSRS